MYRLILLFSLLIVVPVSFAEERGEGDEKRQPARAHYIAIGVDEGEHAKNRIVVNIKEGSRNRYMQVKVQAMSRDETVIAALKANQPALVDAMIMLFAHQDGASMSDIQQREQVREEATEVLRKVVQDLTGITAGLEAVYFTDFVIQ